MRVSKGVVEETEALFVWEHPFVLLLINSDSLLTSIGIPHDMTRDVSRRTEFAGWFLQQVASVRTEVARRGNHSFTNELHRLLEITFDKLSTGYGENTALYLIDWLRYFFVSHKSRVMLFDWHVVLADWRRNRAAGLSNGDTLFGNSTTESKVDAAVACVFDDVQELDFRCELKSVLNVYNQSVDKKSFYVQDNELCYDAVNISEIIDMTRISFRICLAWRDLRNVLSDVEAKPSCRALIRSHGPRTSAASSF